MLAYLVADVLTGFTLMAKRSRSQEEIRFARTKIIRLTDMFGGIISAAIKWGAFAYISFQIREVMVALAGHSTFVSIFSSIAANVSVNQWAAYILAGGGTSYGLAQRRLRKRKVAQLADRIKHLEGRIDPGRSSSGIGPHGTTPKDY